MAVDALLHGASNVSDNVTRNLYYAIAEGLKDPDAVPELKQLLGSNDAEIRRAAASALRKTHSSEAIRPLISALDDPDFDVRFYSVVGLAETTGHLDWQPNIDDFRADEGKYLNHWKEWARSQ
jgi:HEAT repeat protein